ncbi:unnamed protein product [Gadus morhua 'NCC']|uniref:pleckstrin homology-like domain-containing protein n=1 Tax=Gadus chalcogrammus TaxID=1042646 RepID=UPI0024C4A440|nr:pleckstrin homology-like domain-containing protein [Gadus chalcogrammus]
MTAVDPPGGEPFGAPGEKTGWLSKRAHFTLRWRPTWFHLKGGRLLYGESDQSPVKTIPLVGAEVGGSDDPLGWTITPQGAKRCFHLRAASEAEQQSWLRGIFDAQIASARHGTHACVLQ